MRKDDSNRRPRMLPGLVSSVLAACLLTAAPIHSAPGDLVWSAELDTGGHDISETAILLGDRLIVAGQGGENCFPECESHVRAYDAHTGDLLWESASDIGSGNAGRLAGEGNRVYSGGRERFGETSVAFVRAHDLETGAILWEQRASRTVEALASRAGMVFAATTTLDANGTGDLWIRAHDGLTGEVVWEDLYGAACPDCPEGMGGDLGRAVTVGAGAVYVGGFEQSEPGHVDWTVRAYDRRTGSLLWVDRVDRGEFDEVVALAVTGGRVVAAGTVKDRRVDKDFYVRSLDATTGALLWEDQVDGGGGADVAWDVVAHRGSVYVVGMVGEACRISFFIDCDILMRAYDASSGALLWENRTDVQGGSDDKGWTLVAQGDRVYVGGETGTAATGYDLLVRAHDAESGALVWEDRFDGGFFDLMAFRGLAVRGGHVYAACWSFREDLDWFVLAYDAGTEE